MSDPSPERIRRARERGVVATSQRLSATASLACGLAVVSITVRLVRDGFTGGLRLAARAAATDASPDLPNVVGHALTEALGAMAPVLAASILALAGAHALQTRFLVTWPDDDDPAWPSPIEASITVGWLAALGATACAAAWSVARDAGLGARGLADVVRVFPSLLSGVAWRVLAVAAALGAIELLWRRARLFEALRPTRDEALRELREQEGDPRARDERRRLHREL